MVIISLTPCVRAELSTIKMIDRSSFQLRTGTMKIEFDFETFR